MCGGAATIHIIDRLPFLVNSVDSRGLSRWPVGLGEGVTNSDTTDSSKRLRTGEAISSCRQDIPGGPGLAVTIPF